VLPAIIMNIFDFIPQHLRANLISDQGLADSLNVTVHLSSRAGDRDQINPSEANALDANAILHEWEQTCYLAWVEMEQDIYCGSTPVSQS